MFHVIYHAFVLINKDIVYVRSRTNIYIYVNLFFLCQGKVSVQKLVREQSLYHLARLYKT